MEQFQGKCETVFREKRVALSLRELRQRSRVELRSVGPVLRRGEVHYLWSLPMSTKLVFWLSVVADIAQIIGQILAIYVLLA